MQREVKQEAKARGREGEGGREKQGKGDKGVWGGLTQADCHKQGLQEVGEALLLHLHWKHTVQVTH